ncbi:MAG TPA: aminotransferase class III-fold pyridoxal phosphate-dependent enzyme, partial [Mucilaginibacter sp.]|nr:aminotransferase class III-fold pyridoxal phosphate-dependent enzyme [Mucilaginibacter sp.]
QQQLVQIAKENPIISSVRGKGLLAAFDFADKETRNKFIRMGMENNVMFLGCGHITIRFRPALIIEKNNIDDGLNILSDIIKKL